MRKISFIFILLLISMNSRGDNLPWYFKDYNIQEVWKITKGYGTVAIIVDTPIFYVKSLSSKALFSSLSGNTLYSKEELTKKFKIPSNEIEQCYKDYIHGTAMGCVISCNIDNLEDEGDKYKKITIAGVSPETLLVGVDWGTKCLRKYNLGQGTLTSAIREAVGKIPTIRSALTNDGKNTHPERKDQVLASINISAGSRENSSELAEQIIEAAKDKHTLILAGVGNDGSNLDLKTDYGLYPALLNLIRIFKKRGLEDPIIRIGGIGPCESKFRKCTQDEKGRLLYPWYSSSNYGSQHVEIAAPAAEIPVMTPKGKAVLSSGTSEATAILTAVAALLASCQPYATAAEIKQAILENADQYGHLKDKVKDGRVLNIYKTVEAFCRFKDDNPYDTVTVDEKNSDL